MDTNEYRDNTPFQQISIHGQITVRTDDYHYNVRADQEHTSIQPPLSLFYFFLFS